MCLSAPAARSRVDITELERVVAGTRVIAELIELAADRRTLHHPAMERRHRRQEQAMILMTPEERAEPTHSSTRPARSTEHLHKAAGEAEA